MWLPSCMKIPFGLPMSCYPGLLAAWKHWMDGEDRQHQRIKLALQCSVKIDKLIDGPGNEFVMEGDTLAAYRKAIRCFLVLQNSLAKYYNPRSIQIFDVTIKSHYLDHSGDQAAWLHPKKAYCYCGEDLMQKIKTVVTHACHGMCAQGVGRNVMEKYCAGMHFELSPERSWYRG